MNTIELTGMVTALVDDLDLDAASSGTGLGFLLAEAEPITDDAALLEVMEAGFRLSTIGDYLMAAAANRAQAIGVPVRHKLTTGRDLLRALPLAPAVVARLGRLGDNLIALPHMAREVRDGDLSLEHADAMIRGIAHIASRMDVDGFTQVKDAVATRLLAHAHMDSPAHIAEKARELAHELAPAHPPAVAPADNPGSNRPKEVTGCRVTNDEPKASPSPPNPHTDNKKPTNPTTLTQSSAAPSVHGPHTSFENSIAKQTARSGPVQHEPFSSTSARERPRPPRGAPGSLVHRVSTTPGL